LHFGDKAGRVAGTFPGGLVSLTRLHSALLYKVFDGEGFTVSSNAEQLAEGG
jgi:hypothetical protein